MLFELFGLQWYCIYLSQMRLKIHQNGVGTQAAICIIGNMHQASLVTCYATIWFIIITVSVIDSMDEFIFNKGVLLNI